MFRKVRKVKNEITVDDAKNLLKENKRGAFSVNGDSGYPYTIPVNFYYDEDENKIYFHTSKVGHKIDSIKNDNKVCFTTWDDGYLEDDWAYHVSSCVVFGCAKLIDDSVLKEKKLRLLGLKYYPNAEDVEIEIESGLNAVQIIEIDIEYISGKRVHER